MNGALTISVREGVLQVQTYEIVYLQASRNYTRIYLNSRLCILSAKTLKEYENKLSESSFCRVRSSHLVNTDYVIALRDNNEMMLPEHTVIKIAKRRRTAVLKHIRLKLIKEKSKAATFSEPVLLVCSDRVLNKDSSQGIGSETSSTAKE